MTATASGSPSERSGTSRAEAADEGHDPDGDAGAMPTNWPRGDGWMPSSERREHQDEHGRGAAATG